MTAYRFPDGSYVRRDPLTPYWTAHPRLHRVLKNPADMLPMPYRTAADAIQALIDLGYAKGESRVPA